LDAEITGYFVARNVQTHALKYHGVERRAASIADSKQPVQLVSEPVPYSQHKSRDATAGSKRGHVAFGWVVILSSSGREIACRASEPEVLQWVRKNPPRERVKPAR
jgi:hypothetical protein